MKVASKISLLFISILLLFILLLSVFYGEVNKHINLIKKFNEQKQLSFTKNIVNHQIKYNLNIVKDYTFWD